MSYANKLSSFEHSFLLRATTAHALRVTIPMPAPGVVRPGGRGGRRLHFVNLLRQNNKSESLYELNSCGNPAVGRASVERMGALFAFLWPHAKQLDPFR